MRELYVGMVQFVVESVVESEESELLTMDNVELKIQPLFNLTMKKVVTKIESFIQHGSGITLQSVSELHGLGCGSITLYTTTHRI